MGSVGDSCSHSQETVPTPETCNLTLLRRRGPFRRWFRKWVGYSGAGAVLGFRKHTLCTFLPFELFT